MIELIAYEQRPTLATDMVGKQWTLDITQPGSVSLNYEVSKGEDVMGRYSPFTQTFRLPFTNYNSRFFALYYDVNLTPSTATGTGFDIHSKTVCEIRVDGIPIIQGTLQLKNVHTKSEEYEVVVFGEEANIFQEIKDKKLIDLFINDTGAINVDYDVALTPQNIINSWNTSNDVTEGSVGNGVVLMPLADYGLAGEGNFLYYGSEPTGFFSEGFGIGCGDCNMLMPYMFKPAIQLSHLFALVFTNQGYELNSNSFLTSDAWTKLYMTLGTDRETVATRGVLGLSAGRTFTDPVGSTFKFSQINGGTGLSYQNIDRKLELNNTTGAGYLSDPPALFDVEDNWSEAQNWFTAPADGIYYGRIYMKYFNSFSDPDTVTATVKLKAKLIPATTTDSAIISGVAQEVIHSPSTAVDMAPLDFAFQLQAGDHITANYGFTWYSGASGSSFAASTAGTYLIIYASELTSGVAQLPNNMPSIQQGAFVKDICQRFNLCIVADTNDPKKLTVQPWQDYLDAGTRKDWTDRLDTSKEFTIKPTDSIRKKYIHFTDAEDSTIANAQFQEANGYVIGEYKQQVGKDYTSGTLKNDPIFAPFQVGNIPASDTNVTSTLPNALIHKGYGIDTNGAISDAQPKLFYYNGTKDFYNEQLIYIGDVSTGKFPLCLPFYNNGNPIESDSPLALWQWQPTTSTGELYFGSTPSTEGYFARYHQQYLMSIYGDDARLVECQLMLSATDIFNFRFNDEIIIKNTAYRILKIANYQPFANVPCKVTLLKKLDAFKGQNIPQPGDDCELIYMGLLQNGYVQFQDPGTGSLSYGNEQCCTENGYTWNSAQSACMWVTGHGGSGNGFNDGKVPNTANSEGKSLVNNINGIHGVKSKLTKNHNPIVGEISIQGVIKSTGVLTTQKNVVFYATSYSNAVTTASPTGRTNDNGSISLPTNMMARIVIRALSVQTDNYSATSSVGSLGSTSFKVWTFAAKNVNGSLTIRGSEQTDFAQEDTDAGTRTVSVVTAKGGGSFQNNDVGFTIRVTGPTNTVCAWNLDCSITFMDISAGSNYDDHLLLESMGYILAESGVPLAQET
ncbi:MAG: hypothetical protein CMC15_13660 [Flavobacteriaceae bacterium]|nr:hypothetical protein [Flavobacteriaceae bacterium]